MLKLTLNLYIMKLLIAQNYNSFGEENQLIKLFIQKLN